MPTNRKFRTRGRRLEGAGVLNRHLRRYFETGAYPNPADVREDDGLHHDPFLVFAVALHDDRLRALWTPVREAVLTDWIATTPGTRPYIWWHLDAPEPRRRLGGRGQALHECLAVAPTFAFGLPASGWLDPWLRDFYRGTARDVHGHLVNPPARSARPRFAGVAYDPADPPRFESQAGYLKRHRLLTPEEVRRLPPQAFTDELVIGPELEDETDAADDSEDP